MLPEENLWDIARRVEPAGDPRDKVALIREINRLPSSELRAGQELLVPTSAAEATPAGR